MRRSGNDRCGGHYSQSIAPGGSYQVFGKQFNGLFKAAECGDEFPTPTNYPLVRITKTGHVVYARTHDHSIMAVATGDLTVGTHFDVPTSIVHGSSRLEVGANGIASESVGVVVQ